ncbi:conserved hypothetical protein [Segniliparus rotundus DSM 44985]|uniref:Uncharacterized protein n=1 Tax=Segniliparus rotundus (strain ATCC BAA-972 / CDC 1076 / CIP 108378 / DSM 44985 / JCM 13578) TaxID=640132 RepID=D6Z8C5_SEGRD|nr:hypothetical protein [Segniliparus rotundus]ADG98205.1 conserved hypothetical protein [Segniliparus rotundus DSM 44985]
MVELFAIVLLALLGFLLWRRFAATTSGGVGAHARPATLTFTGVSPVNRPAGSDEAFCAISGILSGPELPPTEVYQRLVIGPQTPWPSVGQACQAAYLPGKAATHWQIAGDASAEPWRDERP